MPGIGFPEIMVILIVALLVFGPRKLPELGKSLGAGLREFRRSTQGLKEELEGVMQEAPAAQPTALQAVPSQPVPSQPGTIQPSTIQPGVTQVTVISTQPSPRPAVVQAAAVAVAPQVAQAAPSADSAVPEASTPEK